MHLVMWTHVRDYDDWKAAFLEFPSRQRARAFLDDPRLKAKMRGAGVDSDVRTMFVSQTQHTGHRGRRAA